jgi:photosystem II stability/assembly factor-like uncharacterized protein
MNRFFRRHLLLAVFLYFSFVTISAYAQDSFPKWTGAKLSGDLYSITSVGDTLWVFGADETIASSQNQGKSWKSSVTDKNGEILLSGQFVSKDVGFATGTNGTFYSTIDGGTNWTRKSIGSFPILMSAFASEKTGIIVAPPNALFTSDGGQTWTEVKEVKNGEAANLSLC